MIFIEVNTKGKDEAMEKANKTNKTLIFNGSPRKNGDTAALIKLLTEKLTGEYKITDAFYGNISPCTDCRFCQKTGYCKINDDMSGIYDYVKVCDNIVIASPVYFSELTGSLLNVFSRFQCFYCRRRFLGGEPVEVRKKGGVILVGGGDGSFDTAEKTAKALLKHLGADTVFPLTASRNTDSVPAAEDKGAAESVLKLADFLNLRC